MTMMYLCYFVTGISSDSSRRIVTKSLRRNMRMNRHRMPSINPSYLTLNLLVLLPPLRRMGVRLAKSPASLHRPTIRVLSTPSNHWRTHQNQSIHSYWIFWTKTVIKFTNDKTAIRNYLWILCVVFGVRTPISSHCRSVIRRYWANDKQQPLQWPLRNELALFTRKIVRTMANQFWPISLVENIWTAILHHRPHPYHRQR